MGSVPHRKVELSVEVSGGVAWEDPVIRRLERAGLARLEGGVVQVSVVVGGGGAEGWLNVAIWNIEEVVKTIEEALGVWSGLVSCENMKVWK